MTSTFNSMQSLFERYQDGASDTVVEIIEIERPRLFDFVMRMTGERERALTVLDEVTKALVAQTKWFEQLQQLRVLIYATVRSFSADLWNKDVSHAFNAASIDRKISDIEVNLLTLPSWEREPLMLKLRCGFSSREAAEIMSVDQRSMDSSYAAGSAKIGRACSLDAASVEKSISSIPLLPLARTGTSTVALSQLMGDIEKARGSIKNRHRLMMFGAVIIIVGAYFLLGFI